MAANGISNLSTKQAKQVAKLNLAQNKRQGYTLNDDGSIASGPDNTANFYRTNNTYDITELPESYSGNTAVNNGNGANLIQGRPWILRLVTSGLQLYLDADVLTNYYPQYTVTVDTVANGGTELHVPKVFNSTIGNQVAVGSPVTTTWGVTRQAIVTGISSATGHLGDEWVFTVDHNLSLGFAPGSTATLGNATVWPDLSGNGNDVTLQNANNITYTSTGGGYFTLASTGFFDRTTTTGVPTGSSAYCLSVWINTHPNWGTRGFVGIGNDFTTNHVNEFRAEGVASLKNYWWNNDLTHSFNVSGTDPNNTYWLNLVAQWDGTSVRSLWANGVQQVSGVGNGLNVDTSYVQVGRTKTNEYLGGKIGQVLIYNRALTSDEILQNFNTIKTRYGY